MQAKVIVLISLSELSKALILCYLFPGYIEYQIQGIHYKVSGLAVTNIEIIKTTASFLPWCNFQQDDLSYCNYCKSFRKCLHLGFGHLGNPPNVVSSFGHRQLLLRSLGPGQRLDPLKSNLSSNNSTFAFLKNVRSFSQARVQKLTLVPIPKSFDCKDPSYFFDRSELETCAW